MSEPILQLRSSNAESTLTLRAAKTTSPYASVRFDVDLSDEGFSGSYDGVWVEMEELARFASDLRACEQTRDGAAGLKALSPEEFTMAIARCDVSGHFDVVYQLGAYRYSRRGAAMKTVSGVFDLDSEFLGEMASSAAAIVAWARADLATKAAARDEETADDTVPEPKTPRTSD